MPKLIQKIIFILLLAVSSEHVYGNANLTMSSDFQAADSQRQAYDPPYMDIGGTWNGSSEVTATGGDSFIFTVTNSSTTSPAFDLGLSVALPAGMDYANSVTADIDGTNLPLSATQSGTNLIVSVPADTDLNGSQTLTLTVGLTTTTSASPGLLPVELIAEYGNSDNATTRLSSNAIEYAVVRQGATVLQINPASQVRTVNSEAEWTIGVINSGLGGLFQVSIDQTAISPSGNSLEFVSISPDPAKPYPGTVSFNGTNDIITLDYLFPGKELSIIVKAKVISCFDINNEVSSNDRTGSTPQTGFAAVALDLKDPLISFTPPTIQYSLLGPTRVNLPISNTKLGSAKNLKILSDLNTKSVNISVVNSSEWSYAPTTGDFTYVANAGVLVDGATSTLSFDINASDYCNPVTGPVIWGSDYSDFCDNPYETPSGVGSLSSPVSPGLFAYISGSADRVEVGQSGITFTTTVSASNLDLIQTWPQVVTQSLPVGTSLDSISVTAGSFNGPPNGTVQATNNSISWSIPKSALQTGSVQLVATFTAPTDVCLGGTFLTSNVSATNTTVAPASCSLTSNDTDRILLINNMESNVLQNFNVSGGPFQAGHPSTDSVAENEPGEGQPLNAAANYSFGPAFAGTWAGTVYRDNFGGLAGQTLIPGTLKLSLDGGSAVNVPAGSQGNGNGFYMDSANNDLVIELDFIAGASWANSPNIALGSGKGNRTLVITYQTTVPDSDLPSDPAATGNNGASQRNVTQLSSLNVNGASGGCGGNLFTQGDFVSVFRANATIGVVIPDSLEVCEVFKTRLNLSTTTGDPVYNTQVTFPASTLGYSYVGNPTYGGELLSNPPSLSFNTNGDPVWTLSADLAASGYIEFDTQMEATTSTVSQPVTANMVFDDRQHAPQGQRLYSDSSTDLPVLVRKGNLSLQVTPQNLEITGEKVEWIIYVINGGNGVAYSSELENTLPEGLKINKTDTDALNPGFPVTTTGNGTAGNLSTANWDLSNLAAGESIVINVVADVVLANCTVINTTNSVKAQWGCLGNFVETQVDLSASNPNFSVGTSDLLILHDPDPNNSYARLCESTGASTVIIRNTGSATIYEVEIYEVLDPLNTGLNLVVNSAEVSFDSGLTWSTAPDPSSGDGSTGSPYTWRLSDLSSDPLRHYLRPVGLTEGTEISDVRVRFNITATEFSNNVGNQSIQASGKGKNICRDVYYQSGEVFQIPILRPTMNVSVDGINRTNAGGSINTGSYTPKVYAIEGDTVEWKVQISNTGSAEAKNVRLENLFPNNSAPTSLAIYNVTPGGSLYSTPQSISYGGIIPVDNIGAGETATYIITENVGSNCINNQSLTSSVTWGCSSNGLHSPGPLSSPGTTTDSAILDMKSTLTLAVDSINRTKYPGASGSGSYIETVKTGVGETVEWRVRITNTSNNPAYNVKLKNIFAPTGNTSATITGPSGFTSTTLNDNVWIDVLNVPANTTHTYYFVETLGNTCAGTVSTPESNTTSVQWQCMLNSTVQDPASIIMEPALTLNHSRWYYSADRYRLRVRVLNTGQGGTASNVVIEPTPFQDGYVVDTSLPPRLYKYSGSDANPAELVLLDGAGVVNDGTPNAPQFRLVKSDGTNARMFNGERFQFYFYIRRGTDADTQSDIGYTQETPGAGDDALPSNWSNPAWKTKVNYSSGCGITSFVQTGQISIEPRSPDLDIEVSPVDQTVLSGQPDSYTLIYEYKITNNADPNTSDSRDYRYRADNITFRLPDIFGNSLNAVDNVRGWKDVTMAITTPGNGSLSHTAGQYYDATKTQFTNIGYLDRNDFAVITVRATTDSGLEDNSGSTSAGVPSPNLDLTGEVEGNIHGQGTEFGSPNGNVTANGPDSGFNYSIDQAQPVIRPDLDISGFVYLDSNTNNTFENGDETGTGLTLYAKLIPSSGGNATYVTAINPTTGGYAFSEVTSGTYNLVINETNSLTDTTPSIPAGWKGTEEPDQLKNELIVGQVSLNNLNFGLINSSTISGQVFKDTGTGGGIANNGVKDGGESGINEVTLNLYDGTTLLESVVTRDGGKFTFIIPSSLSGKTLRIEEVDPANYTSTGVVPVPSPPPSAPVNPSVYNAWEFTYDHLTTYSDIYFADVPANRFMTNGQKNTEPGTSVFYAHEYIAGSAGDVTFSLVESLSPSISGWTYQLFKDTDCDGVLDSNPTLLNSAVTLAADEKVCILIKVTSPLGAGYGFTHKIDITADFVYANTSGGLVATHARHDLTTIGDASASGLALVKSVLVESPPGSGTFISGGAASPGAKLKYKIAYSNNGGEGLEQIEIHDIVPPFTQLASATFGDTPSGLTPIGPPNAIISGDQILWKFNGLLNSGQSGFVEFIVTIEN